MVCWGWVGSTGPLLLLSVTCAVCVPRCWNGCLDCAVGVWWRCCVACLRSWALCFGLVKPLLGLLATRLSPGRPASSSCPPAPPDPAAPQFQLPRAMSGWSSNTLPEQGPRMQVATCASYQDLSPSSQVSQVLQQVCFKVERCQAPSGCLLRHALFQVSEVSPAGPGCCWTRTNGASVIARLSVNSQPVGQKSGHSQQGLRRLQQEAEEEKKREEEFRQRA